MQILPINNNQSSLNTNFKQMKYTKAAKRIIDSLNSAQKEKINIINDDLNNNLKCWDMLVDKFKGDLDELHITFINKTNPNNRHECGIIPMEILPDNKTVRIISDVEKNPKHDCIEFPTSEKAKEFIEFYCNHIKQLEKDDVMHWSQLSKVQQISYSAKLIKYLDEAYQYMLEKNPNMYTSPQTHITNEIVSEKQVKQKLPFIDRILAKFGLQRIK